MSVSHRRPIGAGQPIKHAVAAAQGRYCRSEVESIGWATLAASAQGWRSCCVAFGLMPGGPLGRSAALDPMPLAIRGADACLRYRDDVTRAVAHEAIISPPGRLQRPKLMGTFRPCS